MELKDSGLSLVPRALLSRKWTTCMSISTRTRSLAESCAAISYPHRAVRIFTLYYDHHYHYDCWISLSMCSRCQRDPPGRHPGERSCDHSELWPWCRCRRLFGAGSFALCARKQERSNVMQSTDSKYYGVWTIDDATAAHIHGFADLGNKNK